MKSRRAEPASLADGQTQVGSSTVSAANNENNERPSQKHPASSRYLVKRQNRLNDISVTNQPPQPVVQPVSGATELEQEPTIPTTVAVPPVEILASRIGIGGKVSLAGTPPPETVIDMSGDPRCGSSHSTPVTTRHYVVDKDGGLANVLVYIKNGLRGNFLPTTEKPLLDQAGCLYQPYVLGVMVNQKFKIRNSDSTLHNVHAQPRKGDNSEFNFAQPLKGQEAEKSFPDPEVFVRFKCDVHPWMFAYVGVVQHPFFTITDTNGGFRLPPHLPPGTYTIEAVHPKAGAAVQEITVNAVGNKNIELTLRVPESH